jgi:FkbM family methyltransferase
MEKDTILHPLSVIDEIFSVYDEIQDAIDPVLYTKASYGFSWSTTDGVILYPANIQYSGFIIVLMRKTLRGTPLILCDDDPEKIGCDLNGTKISRIDEAVKSLPKAIFAICLPHRESLESFSKIAAKLPSESSLRAVNYRSLGNILPSGGAANKSFDIYRKTSIFASARNRIKVREAYALFSDALSRSVFTAVLKRYLFSSDGLIPVSYSNHEYYDDVYMRKDGEVIVDCGGFTGDTLAGYMELFGDDFEEYIIFEPDPANYALLDRYVKTLPERVQDKISTFPYAAGHEENTINFNAFGNSSSVVGEEGDTSVRSVILDKMLENKCPTLIKFDIEGFEAFALQGCRQTIISNRPVIALCIYHHPFDLYELPLMLKRMVPDYSFILRAYEEPYEYVCYAVPPERLKTLT